MMKDIEKLCMGCMNEVDTKDVCPYCGYDNSGSYDMNYLVPGTKIMKRFLVGKIIETNGEGVSYICYDAKTDKTVTLREFFPIGLCQRDENGSVKVDDVSVDAFSKGLKKFISIAEKLSDHPEITAVPGVVEFFEGNGTGYCIYENYESITLREFLLRNGGTLNWEQTATIFMPLLSTVRALHGIGIIHRGISPETIFIGRDGKVRLANICIDDVRTMNTSYVAQIFPGFAAVEQYGSIGEQGTWTDVYALAATIYRVLVGNPPVEAIERVTDDTLTIPDNIVDNVPQSVCEALADALQIMPEDRTTTIEEFKAYLNSAITKVKKKKAKNKTSNKYNSYMLLATILTTLVIAAVAAVLYVFVLLPNMQPSTPDVSSELIVSQTSSLTSDVSETESIVTGTVKIDNFLGMIYQDALQDVEYSKYNFVIDSKEYSASYSARKIISQEPEAGTLVDPDENGKITVRIVISMGDYNINMPDLVGMTEDEAIFALLKAGFQYSNISINEQYDKTAKPNSVTATSPAKNEKVNLDSPVVITINTYAGDTSSNEDSTENN